MDVSFYACTVLRHKYIKYHDNYVDNLGEVNCVGIIEGTF